MNKVIGFFADMLFPSRRLKKFCFVKKNDSWSSVIFTDVFTILFTLLLRRFRCFYPILTPNALSLFSFFFFYSGLIVFYLFPAKVVWVVACFGTSLFLDDIDGKFARATGEVSFLGEIADYFFDMFNHGLGLIVLGILFSYKVGSLVPFYILCPYALFMGAFNINGITRAIMRTKASDDEDPVFGSSSWRKFCDERGLVYCPYTSFEVRLLILLVAPWMGDPSMFLFVTIAFWFILYLYQRVRIVLLRDKDLL